MSEIQEIESQIKRYQDALERCGDFVKHEEKQRIRSRIDEMKIRLKELKHGKA